MSENGENTIRVLIVDDIAETRENIRKLLQFEPDLEVVGAARTGIEAIDIARETEPDVVIMDINMPDMDGITATEALLRDVPFAQIVLRETMLFVVQEVFLIQPESGLVLAKVGMETLPVLPASFERLAAASVRLCATVNAVTVATRRFASRTSSTRANACARS